MNNSNQDPNFPTPEGVDVVENKNEIIIKFSWFKVTEYIMPPYLIKEKNKSYERVIEWPRQPGYIILLFSLIWNSLLIFGFLRGLFADDIPRDWNSFWVSIPGGALAVGMGMLLFYYGICFLVNTTILRASESCVSVSFTPLKWLGEKELESERIKQFYVREKIQNDSSDGEPNQNRYELRAVLEDNEQEELLTFSSPEYAQFIKLKLDKFLGH